jgi:acyl-homoserine-lactone acylase
MRLFLLLLLTAQTAVAQLTPDAIQIARDRWGVPHIFAKTDPEVAYGLAWAHAEDDFKTIQLTMLGGKGMLGQHLGKSGAAIDYVVGLIRAREQARRDYPTQFSPDFRAVLGGYLQGLNAYARAHPQEVLIRSAFPVTEEDAICAFILSNASFSGIDRTLKAILADKVPDAPTQETPGLNGSNAFAISGKHTTSGETFLAINSHQPLEGPVAWYEAHLCSEQGWNIVGGLFPGAPTILHGCNENLGWAHTVNYHDKMDVYQLDLNPANRNQYRLDGQWRDLEVQKIRLRVKGIPVAIGKKAYWSEFGPVMFAPTKRGQQPKAFAMRFAGLLESRSGEQWYRMNKARNFTEFRNALQMTAIAGGFNILYADRADTIFYVSNGKIPLRDSTFRWQQTLPGNTTRTRWTQFHPLADLPQVLNPASGYLFNTNNTPYHCAGPGDNPNPARFDKTMGIETFELNRSVRLGALLEQTPTMNYDDFKRIKYDRQLPAPLAYLTDYNGLFTLDSAAYPDLTGPIRQLRTWNRRADADNTGASVFLLAYQYWQDKFARTGESPYRPLTPAECAEALRHAQTHLMQHFGSTTVPLGALQQHSRGGVSLPIGGLPDVLAAMASKPTENGRFRAAAGESYIELVRFRKEGLPLIETVNAYGASNHADSPHHTDQMPLFVNQQTKSMSLDKAQVLREAVRVYAPK